jgi:hypothetical protein
LTAEDQVLEVVRALNDAGVRYMVVGSLSSNVYGIPRSTKDADFVVELTDSAIQSIVQSLGDAYLLDPQMSFETITGTFRYRLKHVASAFLIELFLISDDSHDQARFARRRRTQLAGQDVYVPTPEDVIITKLRWSRHGNRHKDVDDVRGILSVQGNKIDWDYLNLWCDRHGTRALLDRIRESVPRI